jgi:ATP-dependent Lon protease
MEGEISVLQVEKKIRNRVKRQMEKTQREYYLNEQMKAIQRELGEGEEGKEELAELEERIEATKLSKEARAKVDQEMKKLRQMSPMSAEATVVRNYLDWMLSIPWNKRKRTKADLAKAEAVLDRDHYGLEKVKERIIEHLAVQARTKKLKGPILCLVGPPGVGKTSLGRSIAEATGREFVRMSLGGVRDEAEIRGHRRTYIGSMPGRLIQSMKKAKKLQPAVPAGRDRQAGRGLSRRSGGGAAGSARSGAERHVQRPLSGGRLRPVRRDVHHHGEHAEHAPAACWTAWRSSASPATPKMRRSRSPSAT